MRRFEFLLQEFENVEEALRDTLRHDYGPKGSSDFYEECRSRIEELRKGAASLDAGDHERIAAYIGELGAVAYWISLIERSHLGEFSWPFADSVREVAIKLLTERTLGGERSEPIIYVISDGEGYQIHTESAASSSAKNRRFVIVAFPRWLKHHVLLHALFGHELGHAAIRSSTVGEEIQKALFVPLISRGSAFESPAEINHWLHLPAAPAEVRSRLAEYQRKNKAPYVIDNVCWANWILEVGCDLLGLLIFGPSLAAASCMFLQYQERHAYWPDVDDNQKATHPPYAIRHKLLVRAIHLLGWDRAITNIKDGKVHAAEQEFIGAIVEDPYDKWAQVFTDKQIKRTIDGVQGLLAKWSLGFHAPTPDTLKVLVSRLTERVPPIFAEISSEGKPRVQRVELSQILYAGWVYWFGRNKLTKEPCSFLETNRFCHLALIQNDAIGRSVR
jgi:hypothetical protein